MPPARVASFSHTPGEDSPCLDSHFSHAMTSLKSFCGSARVFSAGRLAAWSERVQVLRAMDGNGKPSIPAEHLGVVGLVAIFDRRVLLARTRTNTGFYLPGGKREPLESDVEALARESAYRGTLVGIPFVLADLKERGLID